MVIYDIAERDHRARARETMLLTNNSHKWWSTLKSAVFDARSAIPPLVGNGGALVSDSTSKADLFLRHFDEKQSREDVTIPQTCFPKARLTGLAFRSTELRKTLSS